MTPHFRVHPPAWAPLRTCAMLAATLGCGHSDPFTSPPYGTDQPFNLTAPTQLTLNRLNDGEPAWLTDGAGILYSAEPEERADNDICLALLPPAGGRQKSLTCDLSVGGVDSTNSIRSAAPAADGRLAFVEASGTIGAASTISEGIAIALSIDPQGASVIQRVPYTIPGEPTHNRVRSIVWLGASRLGFIGAKVANLADCPVTCPAVNVVSDQKIVTLDIAAGATPTVVPGTEFASGLSVGAGDDEIYFTTGGDSRVFRRTLSTGDVTVAFDFGAKGIARDVSVVGSRMAAIVGGRVVFGINPILGPTQRDSGGVAHVVNLTTGDDQSLDYPGFLFRHPALSPDGTSLVAEGYPLAIFDNGTVADTTVGSIADLYLFGAP